MCRGAQDVSVMCEGYSMSGIMQKMDDKWLIMEQLGVIMTFDGFYEHPQLDVFVFSVYMTDLWLFMTNWVLYISSHLQSS